MLPKNIQKSICAVVYVWAGTKHKQGKDIFTKDISEWSFHSACAGNKDRGPLEIWMGYVEIVIVGKSLFATK